MKKVIGLMKKNETLRSSGRWFRRAILKNKYLYLLSSSTAPLSTYMGFDRGTPLDRYYMEAFLESHRDKIQGKCLEIGDDRYIKLYGKNVIESHILDVVHDNPHADIIADLSAMPHVPDHSYDCIILTQVLQFIPEPKKAVSECLRILKPGGSLLVTVPTIGATTFLDFPPTSYWRFTPIALKLILGDSAEIVPYGNCRISLFFLAGACHEEMSKRVLDTKDPRFPILIGGCVTV